MAEAETTGRRPRRSTEPLTEGELAALVERDMPAEVAELLERRTADNLDEARRRTQGVRLDLESRLPYEDWTPEVFFAYAENSLAEARAHAARYWTPNPREVPLMAAGYRNAAETTTELLEVIAPSGIKPFPGKDKLAREQFPAAVAAIEASPEAKRDAAVRAFNLRLEAQMLRDVLGAQGEDGSFGDYIEEQLEYLTAKRNRLIEDAGLTPEDETVLEQRLTLFAMLAKAKHVVPEVSTELGELMLKALPHRGAYPEDFLPRAKEILAERMRAVVAAGNELEALEL